MAGPWARARAYGVAVGLLGLMAYAVVRTPERDSFPHSTFPMFSHPRPRIAVVQHVLGITHAGERAIIPPATVASREVIQTKTIIRHAIARGKHSVHRFCGQVAKRVDPKEFRRLEVRSDSYDVTRYFEGDTKPLHGRVHARCWVGEPPPEAKKKKKRRGRKARKGRRRGRRKR